MAANNVSTATNRPARTPSPSKGRGALVFKPPVDIFQTDRDLRLVADMPGVAPEDIEIDLRDGILTLGGAVRPWEGPDESDVRVEFEIGRYHRCFTIAQQIDHDRIDARFSDGILRLTLPMTEERSPSKRIAIKTG